MILLWGIPSEPPLAMVHEALQRMGAPVVLFNQRHFANSGLTLELRDGQVSGTLQVEGTRHRLEEIRSAYLRPMDDFGLPELRGLAADHPLRLRSRMLNDLLLQWAEIAPGRILNRPEAMGSNMSKPYQMQLIQRLGFAVPETLITNDPERVMAFRKQWGRVIYKSISGVRSIVRELEESDLARLDRIRSCPVQFQARVDGFDVRVHVVGDRLFATRADTNAADYRYATRQKEGKTELVEFRLPAELQQRCLALSHGLGLEFSGIDLKITPRGEVYCFEVNPCPAYSYYEWNTGQPIARAVAEYLVGQQSP